MKFLSPVVLCKIEDEYISVNIGTDLKSVRLHYYPIKKNEDRDRAEYLVERITKVIDATNEFRLNKILNLMKERNDQFSLGPVCLNIQEDNTFKVVQLNATPTIKKYITEPLYEYSVDGDRFNFIFTIHIEQNTSVRATLMMTDTLEKKALPLDVYIADLMESNPMFKRSIGVAIEAFDNAEKAYTDFNNVIEIVKSRHNYNGNCVIYMIEDHRKPIADRNLESGLISFGIMPTQLTVEHMYKILTDSDRLPFHDEKIEVTDEVKVDR